MTPVPPDAGHAADGDRFDLPETRAAPARFLATMGA